jgi:methylmalonyl-CoA mutase C-terminal domain/subunit
VVLGKIGLDTHDRGMRLVAAHLLRAGCEVIYLGPYRSPEDMALAALQEDADVIGTSFLDGGHLGWTRDLLEAMAVHGLPNVPVIVGGTIPSDDAEELTGLGVFAVVTPGTPLPEVVELFFRAAAVSDRAS